MFVIIKQKINQLQSLLVIESCINNRYVPQQSLFIYVYVYSDWAFSLIAFHISSNSKTNNEKAFINFDAVLMHLMQSNFALKDPRVFYICVVARETCIDAKKLSWKLNPTFIFTKWNSINRSFTRMNFFQISTLQNIFQ